MHMRNKRWIVGLLLALLLLASACGTANSNADSINETSPINAMSMSTVQPENDAQENAKTDNIIESPPQLQSDEVLLERADRDSISDNSAQAVESAGSEDARADAAESNLSIYFIDVGQADSALIVCDGQTMLIDGGNAADSNLIYAFLHKHGISHLDYIVATHAHEDHIGGLSGALNYASVGIAYSPVAQYDSRAFDNFVRYLGNQGVSITIPRAGDGFTLGSAEVDILAPVKEYENPNNTSIVLKITYGETSFLFTGDAEREAEQDILEQGYDLAATVLKVGHHGSDTSTTYPFLREIMPLHAIISCGADNSYGHPHENLLSRLRDADVALYRTDLHGDIICVSNGNTVSFSTERNAGIQTNPTIPIESNEITPSETPSEAPSVSETAESGQRTSVSAGSYIGNANSLKFHLQSCRTLPAEHNRVYFDTRTDAVSAGYDPCGNCNP